MSLIVTVYPQEGIVMAGDSRLTITWNSQNGESFNSECIPSSDSLNKIFCVHNKFALGFCGSATLSGLLLPTLINQFVEKKITDKTTIDQIPELLMDFFGKDYDYPEIYFNVGGYKVEKGVSVPHVYGVSIAQKVFNRSNHNGESLIYGATWKGQTDVLTRLFSTLQAKATDESWIDLPTINFPWTLFTLQDAIDFAKYAIRTTIDTMNFQQVEKTVGGPIDILVLRPNEAPLWINKKELH
jgi:hypothetical protein